MNLDILFKETVEDIRQKSNYNTEYSLIKACGLLRLLFLDKHPLLHQINKHYRVKILFNVSTMFGRETISKGTIFSWTSPRPDFKRSENMILASFLATPVLFYRGEEYSVKDIILVCSHVLGGIHKGVAENERERLLVKIFEKNLSEHIPEALRKDFFKILSTDVNLGYSVVKDIISIAIAGLNPLLQKLN